MTCQRISHFDPITCQSGTFYCGACGVEIPPDVNHCPDCGTEFLGEDQKTAFVDEDDFSLIDRSDRVLLTTEK